MATLRESFAVVTKGPELMAGSIPIPRKRNGRSSPSIVATMMAENIATVKARTILIFFAI